MLSGTRFFRHGRYLPFPMERANKMTVGESNFNKNMKHSKHRVTLYPGQGQTLTRYARKDNDRLQNVNSIIYPKIAKTSKQLLQQGESKHHSYILVTMYYYYYSW